MRENKKATEENDSKAKTLDEEIFDAEKNDPLNVKGGLSNGMYNKRDYIAPSAFHLGEDDKGDWMKVGDKFVRPFILHRFPASSRVTWLDALYSHRGDIDVAVHVHPADEREAMDDLTHKIVELETQIYEEQRAGRVSRITKLESDRQKLYETRMKLEENYERLFYVQIAANLYSDSLKELDKEFQRLKTKLAGQTMGIMPTYLRQAEGYKTALPYGKSYLDDKFRNFNTGAAATVFPFYNSEIMHENGILIGHNMSTPTPIIMDFYDKFQSPNPNINVFGKSGAGKSFFVSLLTMRSAARGIRTVIIDPENEFKPITNNLGGKWVRIARGSTDFINPFDVEAEVDPDTRVNSVNVGDKISELANLIQVMGQGLEKHVLSVVTEVLRETYTTCGITEDPDSLKVLGETYDEETGEFYPEGRPKPMPTFGDFHKLLMERVERDQDPELSKLATTLRQFTKGHLYDMFDTQTSPGLKNLKDAPIITFDISKLEEGLLRPIGMYVVMQWTWEKFVKKNQHFKKRIVCDEAWMMVNPNMAGHKMTASFLETAARRIRKRNGALLVASQNFREFTRSDEGMAVLSNSETKFLLGQDPNDVDAIQSQFRLSDGEINFLQTASLGEFLVKTTVQSAHGYAQAFPLEEAIIKQSETYIGHHTDEE